MVGFVVRTLDCTMRETVLSFSSPDCSRELESVSNRPQWPTLLSPVAGEGWLLGLGEHVMGAVAGRMATFLVLSIVQQSCLRFTHA